MRIRLNSGDELDALTDSRRFYHWRAGQVKRIKRGYNKRFRRVGVAMVRAERFDRD